MQTGRSTRGTMGSMPVWGTVLLAVLGGWLLLSVVVALAVGRAIHLADRRSPRKRRMRAKGRPPGVRPYALETETDDDDVDERSDRRRQPRG